VCLPLQQIRDDEPRHTRDALKSRLKAFLALPATSSTSGRSASASTTRCAIGINRASAGVLVDGHIRKPVDRYGRFSKSSGQGAAGGLPCADSGRRGFYYRTGSKAGRVSISQDRQTTRRDVVAVGSCQERPAPSGWTRIPRCFGPTQTARSLRSRACEEGFAVAFNRFSERLDWQRLRFRGPLSTKGSSLVGAKRDPGSFTCTHHDRP